MILNLGSTNRYGYIYLVYRKRDYTKVELVYTTGSGEKRAEKTKFPWEITVPLDAKADHFAFQLKGYKRVSTRAQATRTPRLHRFRRYAIASRCAGPG